MTIDPRSPQLASAAVMVNDEGHVLMLRSAQGPFAGSWSMPFIGVGDDETAEDALERLLSDVLHVTPGPYEFLDTFYLIGSGGERFIVNAFTCVDWQGEPRYAPGIFDDAAWVPPGRPGSLAVTPEVRDWLRESYEAEAQTWGVQYDLDELRRVLTEARGELIAAFEALPHHVRSDDLEDGWTPLDVIAHAAEAEAYDIAESHRSIVEPGHTWREFNDAQWADLRHLRPLEDEEAVRDRVDLVRAVTTEWLDGITDATLGGYVNHPDHGVVQIGERIEGIAARDRDHVLQLRRMAQAAAMSDAIGPDGEPGQGG